MVEQNNVEQIFHILDRMTAIIHEETAITYLEAIAEAGENLFQGSVMQPLSLKKKEEMEGLLRDFPNGDIDREMIRKAFQLAILKGMKQNVQPHHAMTPDGVAFFVAYLIDRFMGKQSYSLFDPAMGTGNLLMAILNQNERVSEVTGAEVDDSLVRIAFAMANLQKHEIQIFQMDSVSQKGIPPVDLIVSDLPVGYYTNDEAVSDFKTKPAKGRMPAEYAIVENAFDTLKPAGYMIVIVPNHMFTREGSDRLHDFIKTEAVTLGLLQLPESMFKAEQHGKSIWMLQKKGKEVKAPAQALFAELPSFSRVEALNDMIQRINDWFGQEIRS